MTKRKTTIKKIIANKINEQIIIYDVHGEAATRNANLGNYVVEVWNG
jgi:hypothetical protein